MTRYCLALLLSLVTVFACSSGEHRLDPRVNQGGSPEASGGYGLEDWNPFGDGGSSSVSTSGYGGAQTPPDMPCHEHGQGKGKGHGQGNGKGHRKDCK